MDFDDILVAELVIYGVVFLFRLGLAAIPASMASKKGYSGVAFYFFGLFMFLAAVIVAAVIEDKNKQQPVGYYMMPYYPPNGYPPNYYPQNGYPQQYYQQNGYPQGYPQQRYPQNGYPQQGYYPQQNQNSSRDTDPNEY